MEDQNQPNKEKLTLETLGPITLSMLTRCYLELNPGKEAKNFEDEFSNYLGKCEDIGGDAVLKYFKAIPKDDKRRGRPDGILMISCAYCLQAMRELKKNERELAWSHMTEARYWCGVALASQGIDIARENTIRATRKNTASKGGVALAEKYKETIKEAHRLTREMCPKEKGWKSQRQAVKAISEMVVKFAKDKGVSISSEQAIQTIGGWLKKMPDFESFFPKKEKVALPHTE